MGIIMVYKPTNIMLLLFWGSPSASSSCSWSWRCWNYSIFLAPNRGGFYHQNYTQETVKLEMTVKNLFVFMFLIQQRGDFTWKLGNTMDGGNSDIVSWWAGGFKTRNAMLPIKSLDCEHWWSQVPIPRGIPFLSGWTNTQTTFKIHMKQPLHQH